MIIRYQLPDLTIQELAIPFHVNELSFAQFCDFRGSRAIFEDPDIEVDEYKAQLTASLENLVPRIRTAGLPFALRQDLELDLIDSGYRIRLGDDLSIMRVYAHIINLINSYTPEEIPEVFTFDRKKLKFEVRRTQVAEALIGLQTGEAIEVLEYQRRASLLMEKQPKDVGNIDFTLGATEMAILVRQKGELLPADKPTRDRFIAQRREIFKRMDLEIILQLRFFFLAALVFYVKTRIIGFSGMDLPRVREIKGGPRPRLIKRKRKRKRRKS